MLAADNHDIMIKDHKNKTCKLIDMTVPSDRNTSVKTTEKLSKYIETVRMWGMKTETILVVIGAIGLMKKGLQKHTVNSMGQSTSMSSVQKETPLGTVHILRKVLP